MVKFSKIALIAAAALTGFAFANPAVASTGSTGGQSQYDNDGSESSRDDGSYRSGEATTQIRGGVLYYPKTQVEYSVKRDAFQKSVDGINIVTGIANLFCGTGIAKCNSGGGDGGGFNYNKALKQCRAQGGTSFSPDGVCSFGAPQASYAPTPQPSAYQAPTGKCSQDGRDYGVMTQTACYDGLVKIGVRPNFPRGQ